MPDMPSGMENISGNLGDTSKLAFLDNIPLDSGGDNSANSQPPRRGQPMICNLILLVDLTMICRLIVMMPVPPY